MRFLFACLALSGCAVCYNGGFVNVTSYPVTTTEKSPEGIAVDPSGFQVDLADLDHKTDLVEECLREKFPDGRLSGDIVTASHCLTDRIDTTIHRSCLRVKVAPDWHVGCQGEQVFPCSVDPALCEAKGFTPTAECPCECRSAIQDQDTVVTTPDLRLYANDLLRIVTTCNDIWTSSLQDCFQ